MKMNWNDLVKSRMKSAGITQAQLAEQMEITQATIARYLTGKREPSFESIAKMMRLVGLDKMTLMANGSVEPSSSLSNVNKESDRNPEYQGLFPLISSVQAGAWTEACEPYSLKDSEMLATTERAGSSSFWLTVDGDSMTAPTGSSLSFPAGVRVLVDPSKEPRNGSYVVAKLTDVNEATFKRLVIDAGQKYLQPLNPSFQTMPINGNCRIVGVVVDAKINLGLGY